MKGSPSQDYENVYSSWHLNIYPAMLWFFVNVCPRVSVYFAIQAKKVDARGGNLRWDGNITEQGAPDVFVCALANQQKFKSRDYKQRTARCEQLRLLHYRERTIGNRESHFFGDSDRFSLKLHALALPSAITKAPERCDDRLLISNIHPAKAMWRWTFFSAALWFLT